MTARTFLWFNGIALMFVISLGPAAHVAAYLLAFTLWIVAIVQDGVLRDARKTVIELKAAVARTIALLEAFSDGPIITALKEARRLKGENDA